MYLQGKDTKICKTMKRASRSAEAMKTEGVGLTELSIKLLQKVEELTLYIIQQNQRIEELEKQVK